MRGLIQWCFVVLLIALVGTASAQVRVDLSSTALPDSLKENAHAVLRSMETEFEVKQAGKGVLRVKKAITVLNKQGRDLAALVIHYDQLHKITDFKAVLFDANGLPTRKADRSDFRDEPNIQGFSLFEDNRVIYGRLQSDNYPYTVLYEFERETRNMLFYHVWAPQNQPNLAVQKASFRVTTPADLPVRSKQERIGNPKQRAENGQEITEWSIAGLKAWQKERFSDGPTTHTPVVYTAPSKFNLGGYAGTMNTWEEFGQFQYNLIRKEDKISEELKEQVRQMAAEAPDKQQLVKDLYRYLQANSRYVSIQLGIGGWQPFEAKVVEEKGYGDCKALSNFLMVLLREAGIKSYYTLIYSGQDHQKLDPQFPISRFNHVILCVPVEQDTAWLECTSQRCAFNYLGASTSGRDVLLVSEEGGQLVSTPKLKPEEHWESYSGLIRVQANGSAILQLQGRYSGVQAERSGLLYDQVIGEGPQQKWVRKELDLTDPTVKQFESRVTNDDHPQAEVDVAIEVQKLAAVTATRILIPICPFGRLEAGLSKIETRRTDISLFLNMNRTDTLRFELPAGTTVEHLPKTVDLEADFGTYYMECEVVDNVVVVRRSVQLKEGDYPRTTWPGFKSFMDRLDRAERGRIILKKA